MSVFHELVQDYYEEGVQKGIAKGKVEGKAEGKAEGILDTLVSLVKKGLLNIKDAAEQGKISEEEFKKLLIA